MASICSKPSSANSGLNRANVDRHAFLTHAGPAQGAAKLGRGNRWVIVGIVVRLPFCSHPVCLPILFRLWARKGTASPVELAGQMLTVLTKAFPHKRIHLVVTPPTTADPVRKGLKTSVYCDDHVAVDHGSYSSTSSEDDRNLSR